MKEEEIKKETDRDWEEIWKPLLYTKGKLDIKKIKNEMHDLIFIYNQIGYVYCELTGNRLSKPMYYAKTIISEHERECEESYQRGYDDAKEELKDCRKEIADRIKWKFNGYGGVLGFSQTELMNLLSNKSIK